MERKKQRITVGAIIQIPLKDDFFTYGRILESKIAFYDARTREEMPIEAILKSPILFIVPVEDAVITHGYWQKVSKAIPIEDNLKKENLPPMFRQSTLKPERIELVYFDRFEKATPEQCTGLERWAVWNLEGIEQRLHDFYGNKENYYEKVDKEIVVS